MPVSAETAGPGAHARSGKRHASGATPEQDILAQRNSLVLEAEAHPSAGGPLVRTGLIVKSNTLPAILQYVKLRILKRSNSLASEEGSVLSEKASTGRVAIRCYGGLATSWRVRSRSSTVVRWQEGTFWSH